VAMHMPQDVRNDVKKGDDKNPYEVDEVPVERDCLIWPVWRSRSVCIAGKNADVRQKQESNHHMSGVERGDRIEDRSIGIAIRGQCLPVGDVFEALKDDKDDPRHNCCP